MDNIIYLVHNWILEQGYSGYWERYELVSIILDDKSWVILIGKLKRK